MQVKISVLVFGLAHILSANLSAAELPYRVVPVELHGNDVADGAVEVAPKANLVLSSGGGSVKLWQLSPLRLVRSFNPSAGGNVVAALAADGTKVAVAAGAPSQLQVYNVDGTLLHDTKFDDEVVGLKFTSDRKLVVVSRAAVDLIGDNGTKLKSIPNNLCKKPHRAIVSANAATYVTECWDGKEPSLIARAVVGGIPRQIASEVYFRSLSLSPDGSKLAYSTNDKARLVDTTDQKDTLLKTDKFAHLSFDASGEFVRAWSDKRVTTFSSSTGAATDSRQIPLAAETAFAISEDGNWYADLSLGAVSAYNAAKGEGWSTRSLRGPDAAVFITNSRLITLNKSAVYAWDLDSASRTAKIWEAESKWAHLEYPRVSPNGDSIGFVVQMAKADTIVVLDAKTHRERWRKTFPVEAASHICNLAFAGTAIVVGRKDKPIEIWSHETGSQVRVGRWPLTASGGCQLATSPSGLYAASSSGQPENYDGQLVVLNTRTGDEWRSKQSFSNTDLAFRNENDLILGSGSEVQLVNVQTRTRSIIAATRDDELIGSLAMAGDSVLVSGLKHVLINQLSISSRSWGSTAIVEGGFTDPNLIGDSIKVSPDGSRAAVISGLGVKIYDTASLKLLATLVSLSEASWLAYVPEGYINASSLRAAQWVSAVKGVRATSIVRAYDALFRPDLVRQKLQGDPEGVLRKAAMELDLNKVFSSGEPPVVKITGPNNGEVAGDTVTVTASVQPRDGGLGRAEWRINGVTRGVVSKLDNGTTSLTESFALDAGESVVDLVVYNQMNLLSSAPSSLKVSVKPSAEQLQPKLFLLAVGINDYWDSRIKLNFASGDAKALSDAVSVAGKQLYREVVVVSLLDRDATRDKLDKAFGDISRQARPQDVFIFFLAGHGKTVDGRYYFIPQEFRYRDKDSIATGGIGQDQLQQWLARVPAKKSIFISDTCESGSLTNESSSRGLEKVAALERLTNAMGRTVLSASTDDAPALEGYNGHGVFTYALLQGIGAADANSDGAIDVTELAAYVDAQVPEISQKAFNQRQVPQMRIVGSNFPLLGRYQAKLEGSATASIPTKPTHVAIQTAEVVVSPGGSVVDKLSPGMQIIVIEIAGGWANVARGGKRLGYVPSSVLAPLQ